MANNIEHFLGDSPIGGLLHMMNKPKPAEPALLEERDKALEISSTEHLGVRHEVRPLMARICRKFRRWNTSSLCSCLE